MGCGREPIAHPCIVAVLRPAESRQIRKTNMTAQSTLSRRHLLFGAASLGSLALAGCASNFGPNRLSDAEPSISPAYLAMYAEMEDRGFTVPAVDLRQIPPEFWRTEVDDPTGAAPGMLVVETAKRYLYLVLEGGRAIRYGVGIGREGFAWAGEGVIGRKAAWPVWTPPLEMQERQPETRQYANGMPGGPENPLGARALYIYRNGEDTLYRLHGTHEFWSIGQAVSSGCVRLLFQDIIDLHSRVPVGTKVIVNA